VLAARAAGEASHLKLQHRLWPPAHHRSHKLQRTMQRLVLVLSMPDSHFSRRQWVCGRVARWHNRSAAGWEIAPQVGPHLVQQLKVQRLIFDARLVQPCSHTASL